ncbi:hypothetical protein DIS24_g1972 [Lasiodiplodia hormozganensis]|uniref:Uncharacterized protein n=1 Tax=Lasiodiplodia hormozganensis TaxID=869390 RepID=A0AA39Z1I5_9PEZI|nr:hypothetical protein DIS24_g1972 [Lasiodiplodia hormozganensis]
MDRNFALRFTIDPARQYLIVNDQQRIALRNGNTAERFSAAIPIFVPVGNLAPSSSSSSSSSSSFSLSRILPPSFFPFPFPPWFHAADATLLSWWLAPSTAVVNLRASWSGATDEEGFGGPMEIWPDDESWYDGSDSSSDGEQQQRRPLPGPPRGTRPLLTVTVVRSQIPNNDIIVSAPPLSVSPTATLAFRRAAFAWLFPAWFLGARLVGACGGDGGGVCWMAVAVVVLVVGVVGRFAIFDVLNDTFISKIPEFAEVGMRFSNSTDAINRSSCGHSLSPRRASEH